MKKLMIMLAAVATAFAVNAASVNWSTAYTEYTDESAIETGSFWVLSLGASSDVSAIKVFEDGTYDFGSATIASQGSITDPYGVMGSFAVDPTDATKGNNSYYALVIWDGKNVADGGMFGVSDAAKLIGASDDPPVAGEIEFFNGQDSFGNATFANQSVAAVPEPTSGLLMLVGLAGLALRRRRA